MELAEGGLCQFAYSLDGADYLPIGPPFQAREGRWMGAKVGLTVVRPHKVGLPGSANFAFFRPE